MTRTRWLHLPTAPNGKGHVRLVDITVRYGDRPVLDHVSLDIPPGQFMCLLGPSGCGKTSTLRAIAGLVPLDEGAIYLDGRLANELPANRRGTAMVFQDLALFPHMTVYENIAFGLRLRKIEDSILAARVSAMLDLLHLRGLESRLPRQLSGGQQQRVALARSLVVNPSVLLLDEPFASLDRKLREEMRREIRALQRTLKITAVFVTHDQEEALTMADTVVVMNHGRLEQVGTPSEVYEAPATRFVLSFVGFSNFLRVSDVASNDAGISCRLAGTVVALSSRAIRGADAGRDPELAIRPERVRLSGPDTALALANRLPGTIRDVTYEGASIAYDVELADGQCIFVRGQNQDEVPDTGGYQPGVPVILGWKPRDAVLIL